VSGNWDWQEPCCRELLMNTRLYHIPWFQLGEDEFLFVDDGLEP